MNGNDRFLNINDAHLRVMGGNVHASSFNLDQISITTTSTTASTIDFLNETTAFRARSNIEVGTANLFVNTETSNVGIGTDAPEYTLDVHGTANVGVLTASSNVGVGTFSPEYALDVHGSANVGALTATTFSGSGAGLTALDAANIATGTLNAARVPTSGSAATLTTPRSIGGVAFDGSAAITPTTFGGATFSGDVTVDTTTFHVDTTNDRVGVGTTSPQENLDVAGTAPYLSITDTRTSSGGTTGLDLGGIVFRTKDITDPSPETGDFLAKIQVTAQNAGSFPDGSLNFFVSDDGDLLSSPSMVIEGVTGNVGIGTTSPSQTFEVNGDTALIHSADGSDTHNTTDRTLYIGGKNSSGSLVQAKCAIVSTPSTTYGGAAQYGRNALHFCLGPDAQNDTNASKTDSRMCIDYTGNVGIGTSTPGQKLSIYTGSTTTAALSFDRSSSGNYRTDIYQNSYGADFRVGYGSYTPATVLYLKRKSDGAKRVVINDRLGINKDDPTKDLHVNGDVFLENSVLWMGSTIFTGGNGLLQLTSSTTPGTYYHDAICCKAAVDGNWIIGFRNTAGSARGQIKGNGANNVLYETSSDERLKKQIKPMESVLERVNNLKACTYTWIRDEMEGYGFIAQDVYKLFPEMKASLPSTVWNPTCDDEYDYPRNEDGTDHYYSLDYGTFTPFLTKAIQELNAKVEERHNRKSFITDIDYLVIEDYEGLIVSANTNEFKNGKPTLTLSKVEKDKRCYGIILGKTKSIDSETIVQRSGDGRMWVINTQGNLESGDLITSSAVSGYGSKQDDDLLRSCTVAKITQDCDFTQKYIPIKCVKREMKDVTYYIQDYYVEVRHFDPYKKEDLLKRDVPMYFKPCEASSPLRGYERVITPFMTQDDYDNLSDEEKENYTVSHVIYKTPYEYEHLNEDDKSEYTETIKTGYYLKEVRESAKPMPECCGEYVTEVRQELVNVLDEHGQIQWEDHPTETEKAYNIRYLNADGVETDEANAVHKAAFVGCTYHCG